MSLPSASNLFSKVSSIEKAAEVAKKAAPKIVELSEEAKSLPPHILSVTEPNKLNKQTPVFRCPPWAGLPAVACHLRCTRDGQPLPSLGLERFPFYLFGRSPLCDYVLQHESISSIHAVLVFHQEKQCFVLMDLGSTNGVKLNGVRIEKRRPVSADIGSTIQFGCSSRIYKLSRGPASSSSKRPREEEEKEKEEEERKKTIVHSKSTTVDVSAGGHVDNCNYGGGDGIDVVNAEKLKTHREETNTSENEKAISVSTALPTITTTATTTAAAAAVAVATTPAPPAPEPRHLYHLLIKHKEVRRPVSFSPRNKGEKITRSKTDALELAGLILVRHDEQHKVWTKDEFISLVHDYSECGTAKKDGDLGLVNSGEYPESFDSAAFSLGCGTVSRPVETELGVHLIYRAE